MSAGERLVTVLVTVVVPEAADPEDAAALVADAAVSSALDVRLGYNPSTTAQAAPSDVRMASAAV